MTLTAHLASFEPPIDDDAVRHAAVRCVVDWAGCALAGSEHELVEVLERTLDEVDEGGSTCTVVGRPGRRSAWGAALLNGAAAHVLDFDDVNVAFIGHPAVVVIPAVLAAAERSGAAGDEVVAGVVAGYEAAAVIGAAVNPSHYERGWHATATIGCVAAGLAAAHTLGLGPEGRARAISLAATQAGGVRSMFGSHGKGFHAGRAAAAGLVAATMARHGADVPDEVLVDVPAAYLPAVADGVLAPASTGRVAVLDTCFKGHAACGATHCLIDAVAGLVREHHLEARDITSIDAAVHSLAVRAAGIERPSTGLEAKFSLWHTAAMAAVRYPLLPDAFDDAVFAADDILALRDRVTITVDESFRYEQAMPARVQVTAADGRSFETYVDTPRGRPRNPMSDDELTQKFLALATPVLGEDAADLAASLWGIDAAPDVRAVVQHLGR